MTFDDDIEISISMSAAGAKVVADFLANPKNINAERAAPKLACAVYRAMRTVDLDEVI